MEKNPEIKGRPNPIELKPKPQPSEKTVRELGAAAIKSSSKESSRPPRVSGSATPASRVRSRISRASWPDRWPRSPGTSAGYH